MSGRFVGLAVCLIWSCFFPSIAQGRLSGYVVGWGYNGLGQCNVPWPNSDFIAIAAGDYHGLGLKSDGSVVVWGGGSTRLLILPEPNSGFIAIAAGGQHNLALRDDGSVAAWGYDDYGQCDVPSPNADFVAVAAGAYHSLGLKSDGSIVCWGRSFYGLSIPPAGNDYIAISGGYSHNLALRSDDSVVCWGDNEFGQCNVPAPNSDFVAVAAGHSYSLGLKSDGSVITWGWFYSGQTSIPAPGGVFNGIVAGRYHALGLRPEKSVSAWGHNGLGQCDVPSPNSDFIAIAAGAYHSLAIRYICLYELSGDLNDDCRVDMEDIALLAHSWLIDCNEEPSHPACIQIPEINLEEGHWKFDETQGTIALDSSGFGRDGTLKNGPIWNVSGKINGALQFDGVDDYVKIEGYKGIIGAADRSVCAWIRTDNIGGQVIAWGQDTDPQTSTPVGGKWEIRIDGAGRLTVGVGNGYISGTKSVADNQWHHIAVVFENDGTPAVSDIRLYIDGLQEAIGSLLEQTVNTLFTADLEIGVYTHKLPAGNIVYYRGDIDDVRIYAGALTLGQIIAISSSQ